MQEIQKAQSQTDAMLKSFYEGLSPRTLRGYSSDLAAFAKFLGAATPGAALHQLLGLQGPGANAVVLDFINHMRRAGLGSATVNRRLAALRAVTRLARVLGFITWAIEVQGRRRETQKDLAGPPRNAIREAVHQLGLNPSPKCARDAALIRLLYDLGLRRNEVVTLDVEHLDVEQGCLFVQGKGREGRTRLTLPPATLAALKKWLAARGPENGPLFTNFDRARKGRRIDGSSIYRIVRANGLGRPHGLRHSAITAALDLFNGDLRKVQRFSRHRDVRLLNVYDDNRQDLGGQVANALAAGL